MSSPFKARKIYFKLTVSTSQTFVFDFKAALNVFKDEKH